MKKIILSLLLGFISLGLMSQGYNLNINGYVTSDDNGDPVGQQMVNIMIPEQTGDSTMPYFNTVLTDPNGYFSDVVPIPPNEEGVVIVETYNCDGNVLSESADYSENSNDLTFSFVVCTDPSGGGDCQAMFGWQYTENVFTLAFTDFSMGEPDTWNWDFGDGGSSSEQNPEHTYAEEGAYDVTLEIYSDSNSCSSVIIMPVYVSTDTIIPGECEAMFNYRPANIPLTLEFINLSIGNPDTWSWDFGDGTASSEQNPVHTFAAEGEYLVSLEMSSDSNDCSSFIVMPVYVGNDTVWPGECSAMYFYFADSSNYNTINFVDLSMGSNGNIPSSWSWDFGDGTASNEQNPTHTYQAFGDYEVCLTITSIDDVTGDTCQSDFCSMVNVVDWENECQAAFYYYPEGDPINGGLDIQFLDNSWGNPTEWSWDFGDGSSSNEQNPIHSYTADGIYQVCLSVSSPNCESTYCEDVFVFNDTIEDCFSWFEYNIDNLTVDFSGFSSSPEDSTSYSWSFGDGASGTGQNIVHTYAEAGIYFVELIATSSNSNCSSIYTEMVWVGSDFSFSVYGNIYLEDSLTADYATVNLMTFDTLGQTLVSYATTQIDEYGYYQFDEVPMENCMYFVQAELTNTSAYYGDYVPTYHYSALNWEYADPVFPSPSGFPYDVYMIADSNTTNSANGNIEGVVNSGESRGLMSNVEILLLNENGSPITYLRTDENGNFNFSELDYGTYIVYTEIVGIETTPVTITLTEENPEVTINIVVANGEAVLGIGNQSAVIESLGDISPNPVSQNASLNISLKEATTLQIEILNQMGQIVSVENKTMKAGENRVELQTSGLHEGLYILNITPSDGISSYKKFIKLR